jgi:hypothetical protein
LRGLADPQFVYKGDIDFGFAPDAEHAGIRRTREGHAQTHRCRAENQRSRRAGVQHDGDLLAIDGAINNKMTTLHSNGPVLNLDEFAAGCCCAGVATGHRHA